ncbi:disintegrin and metalloproteinase domain-containing protein 12-like isoform X3 [Scyliorhinus torazame]|uniref:disintegrin and metalloproteinase domain-containing protein 12-like isoform X3 n=1 Tax=Scyliorhinus torazame TaxID=75743 RepID=UPI003B5B3B64
MFASCVCWVFLIWCQVLNRSAAANEETAADDMNAVRNGTLLPVPSTRPIPPLSTWGNKIKGVAPRVQDAASCYHSHQKTLLEELKDYKVVFPKVLSGKKKRSISTLPQSDHPEHISVSVEIGGEERVLDLSRNDVLLPRGFQVSHYDSNDTLVTEKETEPYRCSYEGSVRSFPGSQVSARTCPGLSALLSFNNQSYVLQYYGGDQYGFHLLFTPEDLPSERYNCAVNNIDNIFPDHLQRSQRVKRDVLGEMRYLELVLVADNAMYQTSGNRKDAVVNRLLDVANAVDMFYRQFQIRISLVGVEVWTTDQVKVDTSASVTMTRFLNWRKNTLLPRLHNDNAHLAIGGFFKDGISGLATYGGICSVDQSGGVNTDSRSSYLGLAAILAHEIGHNLGMSHDTDSRNCNCPDKKAGCLMEEAIGFSLPSIFSSCSKQDLERSMLIGRGICLYNLPNLDNLVGGPVCGNLYVEKGEECDCGKPAECSDSCCEPASCTLKAAAKCSSLGACCENCEFLPAATPCRPSRGECDLPEFCRGDSSDCPENVYVKDGHTCGNGNLYCSDGTCQSAEKQCQDIWGEGATTAEDICYSVTNRAGNEYGNCGKDENDNYIKCLIQNIGCGKIQCKGGNTTPLQGGNLNILTTTLTVAGVKYVCRGTVSTLPDSNSPDLVQQGTKCGDNKACVDTKCQDVAVFNVQNCDQACNNKGVCNSKDHCHCQDGWSPPYCAVAGGGGSIDSGPMSYSNSVTSPVPARTDRSITTVFQKGTSETPVRSPETTRSEKSITTAFQKSTQEIPVTSPVPARTDRSITTVFQKGTSETPGKTHSTTLVIAIVVPLLILLTLIALLTWFCMKKKASPGSVTATRNTTSPGSRVPTNLKYSLPNTIV